MKITFVNHASTIIETEDVRIITDPWFHGSAFNEGWNLIYENEKKDEEILNGINFIWISHEHPDHFQPAFFMKNKNYILENNIKVLFQKTKDNRVKNFLEKQNIQVIDMFDGKFLQISKMTKCKMYKAEFYDSSLFVESNNKKYLNINDCQYTDDELRKIKKECGDIDIFFTQFSYAAWKGGLKFSEYRKQAAEEKLNFLFSQYEIINPKILVPFASFIYFSHKSNKYMNDEINKIEDVVKFLDNKNVRYKILSPDHCIDFDSEKELRFDDTKCKNFWNTEYNKIDEKKFNEHKKSFDYLELSKFFINFKNKIISKNSLNLMRIIFKFKFLGIFQPVIINLYDLNQKVKFSFFTEDLEKVNNELPHDADMHSNSLAFIFNNDFGFDTLSVNAMFESNFEGFKKLVLNFGIGSYNCNGMYVSLKSIFDYRVIYLVFKKIYKLKIKLN